MLGRSHPSWPGGPDLFTAFETSTTVPNSYLGVGYMHLFALDIFSFLITLITISLKQLFFYIIYYLNFEKIIIIIL